MKKGTIVTCSIVIIIGVAIGALAYSELHKKVRSQQITPKIKTTRNQFMWKNLRSWLICLILMFAWSGLWIFIAIMIGNYGLQKYPEDKKLIIIVIVAYIIWVVLQMLKNLKKINDKYLNNV